MRRRLILSLVVAAAVVGIRVYESQRHHASVEVVSKTQLSREAGYDYFLHGSEIWRVQPQRGAETEQLVKRVDFTPEPGYAYFLDRDGNVARAR